MTDNESTVYEALRSIRNILPPSVDNVQDNEEIRFCIDSLTDQLLKVVGKRIIRESRKNGQTSTS